MSSAVTFVVGNQGDVGTGLLDLSLSDPAGEFYVVADTCYFFSLAPLSTCSISVTFAPHATSVGPKTATLTVLDGGVPLASATLSGTVYSGATLVVTSAQSNLGAVPIGTTGTTSPPAPSRFRCQAPNSLSSATLAQGSP